MKVIKLFVLIFGMSLLLSSCSSSTSKRDYNECLVEARQTPITKIFSDLLDSPVDSVDLVTPLWKLLWLYNDNERISAVCRVLDVTPSIILRLTSGETKPEESFHQMLIEHYARFLTEEGDFVGWRKYYDDFGLADMAYRYGGWILYGMWLLFMLSLIGYCIPSLNFLGDGSNDIGFKVLLFMLAFYLPLYYYTNSVSDDYADDIYPKVEVVVQQ